jgi:hypothetical protein
MEKVMPKRHRRTDQELFRDILRELSKDGSRPVSNTALRNRLGWEPKKYDRIKNTQWEEGRVRLGRGRGGTVNLAKGKTVKLFLSYSSHDEVVAKALIAHLEPLKRIGILEAWHFRELKAGENWDQKVSAELLAADIVGMLISVDFINSKYITDVEVASAMKRHAAGEAAVVPIIARNCLWKISPLGDLQALPKDGKPIASWTDRDDALVDIATGLRQIAEDRTSNT